MFSKKYDAYFNVVYSQSSSCITRYLRVCLAVVGKSQGKQVMNELITLYTCTNINIGFKCESTILS